MGWGQHQFNYYDSYRGFPEPLTSAIRLLSFFLSKTKREEGTPDRRLPRVAEPQVNNPERVIRKFENRGGSGYIFYKKLCGRRIICKRSCTENYVLEENKIGAA